MDKIYGFCCAEDRDVLLKPDRRCVNDDTSALPPTWGKASQRWVDSNWSPAIPRPEGYIRESLTIRPSSRPDRTPREQGVRSVNQFVPDKKQKRRPKVVVPKVKTMLQRPCDNCGTVYFYAMKSGIPKRYCKDGCRSSAATKKRRAEQEASQ